MAAVEDEGHGGGSGPGHAEVWVTQGRILRGLVAYDAAHPAPAISILVMDHKGRTAERGWKCGKFSVDLPEQPMGLLHQPNLATTTGKSEQKLIVETKRTKDLLESGEQEFLKSTLGLTSCGQHLHKNKKL